MMLTIDENYRITTDPYQWIIQKKHIHQKTKEEYWKNDSFHPNIEYAVRHLGRKMLRESEASTLSDALLEIDLIASKLHQALDVDFEVKRRENNEQRKS